MKKIIQDCMVYENNELQFPNDAYYEVIAVNSGAMVFAREHLDRLNSSLKNAGIDYIVTDKSFYDNCSRLFQEEGILESNIRYVVYRGCCGYHQGVQYYDVKLPSEEEKENGCAVKLVNFERHSPNVKRVDEEFQKIREELSNDSVYEYIFSNSKGEILEGTRTNVYFVVGERLFTASIHGVLKGITRIYVNKIAKKMNVLNEEALNTSNLDSIDAAFLTGTLVGVLPISKINGMNLDSKNNDIVVEIISEYNKILNNDIKNNQIKL